MKIGVLMGGISAEREVSLKTGENMYRSINLTEHEAQRIILDSKQDVFEKCRDIEFALIALHGKYGEDGQIQSILDAMGIPYSGSDVKSSAVSMDKDMSKVILRGRGVNTADWIIIRTPAEIETVAIPFLELKTKVVVKPNSGGSSVKTFICEDAEQMTQSIKDVLDIDREVMVEEFIDGDEITVPILGEMILPTIMISSPSGFFDYTAKYQDMAHGGAREEIVELEPELQETVNQMALATYHALKCSVYGRVDFRVRQGIPYVLEINTLPGMTATSLIPQSAASVGIGYEELIERIIGESLKQRAREMDAPSI